MPGSGSGIKLICIRNTLVYLSRFKLINCTTDLFLGKAQIKQVLIEGLHTPVDELAGGEGQAGLGGQFLVSGGLAAVVLIRGVAGGALALVAMSQRRLFYVAVSACHIAVKIARIILKKLQRMLSNTFASRVEEACRGQCFGSGLNLFTQRKWIRIQARKNGPSSQ
jgi:hypothetical protein